MKKTKLLLLSTLFSFLVFTGCTTPKSTETSANSTEKISVKHELGSIELPKNPKKIAVFDMGFLDTIDGLSPTVEIGVPGGNIPTYLQKYKTSPNLGTLKEPNMEKLFEFAPDFIIISARQMDFYEKLSKIAPTWYVPANQSTLMEDFNQRTTILGQLFGKEDAAQKALAQINKKVEDLAKKGSASSLKSLILLNNDGNLSAYGKGSRFGMIHDTLHLPVADSDIAVSTHGQEVGFEYISKINPDMIFVVDRTAVVEGGTKKAEDSLNNDLVKNTNAGKNGKIITLNAETWYIVGLGITSIEKMLGEIHTALS